MKEKDSNVHVSLLKEMQFCLSDKFKLKVFCFNFLK